MTFWQVFTLILDGVAMLGIVMFGMILKHDVEDVQNRIDKLERQPTDDPFKDFKK